MNKRDLIKHFSEPSTWRGLFLICSAIGVAVRPDVAEAIIAVGLAVSGLVGVLFSDAPAAGPTGIE